MKKLLMTIAMTLAVSNAFATEYNEPYVPMLEIPNLISMPIYYDPSHSGNSFINPNKILYIAEYSSGRTVTTLYFMSALNKPNSLMIKGSREQALYEFSKNKCSERKPECTIKDSNRINLYKTPIFISIKGEGDYHGMLSININNIEYIATNSNSHLVEIILSPYTAIPTKLSMDELSAVIYGATH